MKRNDLISDMKRAAAGSSFISRKGLADYMSLKDPKSVDRYLSGLQSLNQRFFIPDVVDQMLSQVKFND